MEANMKGNYVDSYVLVVPRKKLGAYKKMARQGMKTWKKYGALGYYECFGDDMNVKFASVKFPALAKAKPGEVVIVSYILYKSRKHRDRVNALVYKNMTPPKPDFVMPFDEKRLTFGGFKVITGY